MSASVESLFDSGQRSLSGHKLDGDKIVRLIYMDEAGISNPDHEPWVVVSAVIVDADKKLLALQRQLDAIIQRHIPPEHRNGFVFHATELFNGGGPVFKRNDPEWPIERRLEIADEIARLPKKLGLPLTFGMIERSRFPQTIDGSAMTLKEKTDGAHWTAFVTCAVGVEMWMRKRVPNEVCMLVVEKNDLEAVIEASMNTYQDKDKLEMILGELKPHERVYFPLRKIVDGPSFQRKRQSKALQLADFCAYVAKRRAMDKPHFDRFFFAFSDQIVWEDTQVAANG